MELKEYLKIIRKYKTLFVATIAVVVLAVFAFFYLQPIHYNTSLTLNITRSGSQSTEQYKYDDFYRLQADEKFAETIVEWLRSPRIVADIYTSAGIAGSGRSSLGKLSKSVSAEKRSSQVVAVAFSAPNEDAAQKIAGATADTLAKLTQNLNVEQKENTWFKIAPESPVIVRYEPSFWRVLLGSLVGGVFLAFWVVMVRHYLK